MKIRRLQMIAVSIIIGVVLLAAGCSGQPSPSATPSPKPATTTAATTAATTAPPASSTASVSPTSPAASTTTAPAATKVMKWSQPPAMQIDTSKKYTAAVETTLGTFKIQLFPQETPKTVNNFVFLSRQEYYNGIVFHRIIKTFMIQTGDPTGTGMGTPGYQFADELPPKHSYDPGIVAMANSGKNTNGSQFFICTGADAPKYLNPNPAYTQFGQIIEGIDVVQKIASVPVVADQRGELSKPVSPVPQIKTITITEQ